MLFFLFVFFVVFFFFFYFLIYLISNALISNVLFIEIAILTMSFSSYTCVIFVQSVQKLIRAYGILLLWLADLK